MAGKKQGRKNTNTKKYKQNIKKSAAHPNNPQNTKLGR